jgi:hypothetical protein
LAGGVEHAKAPGDDNVSKIAQWQYEEEAAIDAIYEATMNIAHLQALQTGVKNTPEDMERLLKVGRLVEPKDWKEVKKRMLTVSDFLRSKFKDDRLDYVNSFRTPFQSALKEAKFKQQEENPSAPESKPYLRVLNLYLGFVYEEHDRALMEEVLGQLKEHLNALYMKKMEQKEKRRVKLEANQEDKPKKRVKKETPVKVEKENVDDAS